MELGFEPGLVQSATETAFKGQSDEAEETIRRSLRNELFRNFHSSPLM